MGGSSQPKTHMAGQKLGTKRKEVAGRASMRLMTCAAFESWDLRGSWQQEQKGNDDR